MVTPMDLDRTTCRRARLARDARFDGRFFIGVKTTRVFCRPICPAVPPRERNVQYFPTAAAAAEAGFRACLRCRPECAPGTPAWAGAPTTVARALRLIGDGALESDGIDELAARLGVGARHLRRLFVEHLGASPIAVAQTRRLLSAKRLIDETDMPLTAIALAAGYGSIRRFNAAFLASYGRSPRQLRGQRHAPARAAAPLRVQLRYRPPFDWDALLAFLAPRAIPGVEAVDRRAYRRSIEIDGQRGWLEVVAHEPGALRLSIDFPEAARMLLIVSRVRRLFDLDADPLAIHAHLAADPLLAPMVRRRPGLRVPGAWDGFELGVRAILGQQVSVAAATTLAGRLVAAFGRALPGAPAGLTHTFPHPAELAGAPVEQIGVPTKRAEAIRRFAQAVVRGDLSFDGVLDAESFRARLRQLPGVGEWTAEYVALRALGDPDAFPSGDLGLHRATGIGSARELLARAQAWRPWRAYAALHLWQDGSPKVRKSGSPNVRRSEGRTFGRFGRGVNMSASLDYAWLETPVGRLLLAQDEAGLRYVLFGEGRAEVKPEPGWREDAARLKEATRQLRAYFAGDLRRFDLPLAPDGTPFQQRVWQELLEIPYGETISYGELARRIGNPAGSRAVGLANGANPISIVIPCHRVIGSNGKLTGYGGGLKTKEWLLALERGQFELK